MVGMGGWVCHPSINQALYEQRAGGGKASIMAGPPSIFSFISQQCCRAVGSFYAGWLEAVDIAEKCRFNKCLKSVAGATLGGSECFECSCFGRWMACRAEAQFVLTGMKGSWDCRSGSHYRVKVRFDSPDGLYAVFAVYKLNHNLLDISWLCWFFWHILQVLVRLKS